MSRLFGSCFQFVRRKDTEVKMGTGGKGAEVKGTKAKAPGVDSNLTTAELRQGLSQALGEDDDDVLAFPDKLLYLFKDAKPYNLDIPIVPAAVTYPKTAEQVADIVRYAAGAGLKVQARSGGHSYGNYGWSHLRAAGDIS
jgi:FAD binding domain